jgi:hypothetical protein
MSLPLRPVIGLNVTLPALPSYQSWALKDNPGGLPSLVLIEFPLEKPASSGASTQNVTQGTVTLLNDTIQQTSLLLNSQFANLENRISTLEQLIDNLEIIGQNSSIINTQN